MNNKKVIVEKELIEDIDELLRFQNSRMLHFKVEERRKIELLDWHTLAKRIKLYLEMQMRIKK